MHNKVLHQMVAVVGIPVIIFSGTACSNKASEASDFKTEIVKASDPNIIEMGHPERFSLIDAESRKVTDELQANGVVAPDVTRSVAVLSLGGGRVADIKVKLGDYVKKGQLLLQIHSLDLASAFSDYQKAKSNELLARKQLERSRLLHEHGAIATKDLDAAEEAEETAMVDVKTAENHIKVLGGDPDHVTSILDIRAPISGVIVEQNVTGGSGVRSLDATPNLFTIADMSHVWVLCDVYENAISQVHIGDQAEVHLQAYPDRSFKGRVCNIGSVLDPNTRSAKVRIELENPGLVMRSGMFVTASLRSKNLSERLVLPTSAIVRLHDRNYAFLSMGGDRFRKTEVVAGPSVGENLQQIISGVQPHDRVVVNALQFVSASEAK